jgi:uncharacterized cupin superfamily protein
MTLVAHWDEAPSRRFDIGPMGADWDFLGAAAGCDAVGVRRIRIWSGRQSTPVHAHFGEEELFYVLRGSGFSWQEDGVYEIAAGDAILHPDGGPAHTVVAGPDGIDVLAFGDNLRHEAVRFPRIGAAWIGGMVLDTHAVNQFHLEAQRAGPVVVPDEPDARPATVARVVDVEASDGVRDVGAALGARRTRLRLVELSPARESAAPVCHSSEERLFVVLEGDGRLVLDGGEHPVRTGSLVARRAGTGVAHSFRAGERGLTLLEYGDRQPGDLRYHPRTGMVEAPGLGVSWTAAPSGTSGPRTAPS